MRYFVSTLIGAFVAVALFLIMNSLISSDNQVDRDRDNGLRIDFIQVDQDELENIRQRRKPPKPEPPKKPPPPPKLNVDKQERPLQEMPRIEMPSVSVGLAGGGPFLGNWSAGNPNAEGDVIPIVRIEPQYPRQALVEGLSGYVIIEFTIEADGTVSGPKILESKPRRVFDRNAVRAIYRWKFKPRIVNGKAVARRATQRLDFDLANQ